MVEFDDELTEPVSFAFEKLIGLKQNAPQCLLVASAAPKEDVCGSILGYALSKCLCHGHPVAALKPLEPGVMTAMGDYKYSKDEVVQLVNSAGDKFISMAAGTFGDAEYFSIESHEMLNPFHVLCFAASNLALHEARSKLKKSHFNHLLQRASFLLAFFCCCCRTGRTFYVFLGPFLL